ncbi:hypothetical protein [Gulosibacter faecalis]|nr:hypothetical protein [Gulosibacter faecalis]
MNPVEHLETLLTNLCTNTRPDAAHLTLPGGRVGIKFADQPTLTRTVGPSRVRRLLELADPLGDTGHTWRVPPERIELIKQWQPRVADVLPDARMLLGMPSTAHLDAHLDGLLVHGPGPVTLATDHINRPDAVGRLLVQLDSSHVGGYFEVELDKTYDRPWQACAHRLDDELGVSDVTHGHLLHLSFVLTSNEPVYGAADRIDDLAALLTRNIPAKRPQQHWGARTSSPEPVALLLSDDYSDLELLDGTLRATDETLVRTVCAAASKAGYAWAYAGGRLRATDSGYYYSPEPVPNTFRVNWWNDAECPGPVDLTLRRNRLLDPQRLIEADYEALKTRPKHEPYWDEPNDYASRTALLLWPHEVSDELRASLRPSWAVDSALAALKSRGVTRAKQLLSHVADYLADKDRARAENSDYSRRQRATASTDPVF